MVDPAGRERLVRLGDPEVDHRLDRGGPARRLAHGRRVHDGQIDGEIRTGPAQIPEEIDCLQPLAPSGRRTRPGSPDVQLLETRQAQAVRKRPRYAPRVGQVHLAQIQEVPQRARDRTGQGVLVQRQDLQALQVPQRARDRTAQGVSLQGQTLEADEVSQARRNRAAQLVRREEQGPKVYQYCPARAGLNPSTRCPGDRAPPS